ncbi:MAG TPA: hypothetical protein PKD90_06625 [Phnomibacter sp.]|nr:hypothetical protein [Phnomibacter sp.]
MPSKKKYPPLYDLPLQNSQFSLHIFLKMTAQLLQQSHLGNELWEALQKKLPEASMKSHQAVISVDHHLLLALQPILEGLLLPLSQSLEPWAITAPFGQEILLCSSSFTRIFGLKAGECMDASTGYNPNLHDDFCKLILSQFYHLPIGPQYTSQFYQPPGNGSLAQYWQLSSNYQFCEVSASVDLPPLPATLLDSQNSLNLLTDWLKRWLPVSHLSAAGFVFHQYGNTSHSQALATLEHLTDALESGGSQHHLQPQLQASVQMLTGKAAVSANLLPILLVNEGASYAPNWMLGEPCGPTALAEARYEEMVAWATAQQEPLVFENLLAASYPGFEGLLQGLSVAGMGAYLLIPIWYADRPVGMLELSSQNAYDLTAQTALALIPALNALARTCRNLAYQFDQTLDTIVQTRYTAIQPGISWRFKQQAWQIMRQSDQKPGLADKEIYFKQVLPFFAAIDVRNSSELRNAALQQDYLYHLTKAIEQLTQAAVQLAENSDITGLIEACHQWHANVADGLDAQEELDCKYFLEQKLGPMLSQYSHSPSLNDESIATANEPKLHEQTLNLDYSINQLNNSLYELVDTAYQQLASQHPVYLEYLRTDGLELNLYGGAQLSYQLSWSHEAPAQLRLWLLQTLVQAAAIAPQLAHKIPVALQTTQLIIAFGQPISIYFKRPENRFLVDDAFSIGYEVIKKRIEKATLKTTGERLTQPGTIALVFTSQTELAAWLPAIQHLQKQGQLSTRYQLLELNQLQGLSGLLALRLHLI